MSDAPSKNRSADNRQDLWILGPAALVLILIVVSSIIYPKESESFLLSLYNPFVTHTGMVYLWATFGMILLSVYFSCSRYGNIRFGEPGEKPEFSDITWLAMMFSTGVAGAVLFWSIVEPLSNLSAPPQYADPLSIEAYEWSLAYVLLHWGPVTWPWYAVTALPICYMLYRLKKPVLRISAVAEPVLGAKTVNGWIGRAIEIFFIVGLIFSNTAVMGISIPIVAQAMSVFTGYEPNFTMQLCILGVSTVLFTASVTSGLKRGILFLSHANVIIAVVMILYVFCVGPTTTLLNSFTSAFGKMFGNMFEMLFWTSPWKEDSFPKDWTIFYALWMASYGPFMGLFIARISRGRTVRQVLLMSIFGGIAGYYFIHGVFGSYTLYVQNSGIIDAVAILKESGGPAALIAVLQTIPGGSVILLGGYVVFSTIFLATSVDCSAYIMAFRSVFNRKRGSAGSCRQGTWQSHRQALRAVGGCFYSLAKRKRLPSRE